ncbi:MBL fold metallo-hydrolase, partial [Rhodococcus sp. CX]|uniref:MBL fold metallo-hydrolase n=1 Tax=Rhodococcus sp. CX TaxID=2789880 RepID=UPI0035A95BC0
MSTGARREWNVPILVHPGDERLAAHPYRYTPQRNRFLYALTHPRSLPILARMAAAGALTVKGVRDVEKLSTGTALDVPGRPVAAHTPGHTDGHCILHLADRGVVFSGDALVTLDP